MHPACGAAASYKYYQREEANLELATEVGLDFAPENKNALSGRTPPKKASGYLVPRRMCRKWAMNYAYPGSMPASPEGG